MKKTPTDGYFIAENDMIPYSQHLTFFETYEWAQ
jgi:hypothetical protein